MLKTGTVDNTVPSANWWLITAAQKLSLDVLNHEKQSATFNGPMQ